MKIKTKNLVLAAMFIALSFVGANLKIMGTIAFDSMPAFMATLILGPVYGAIIGAIAHFLTAATSGFPLSLPVHIIIMMDMALTMYVFGISYNKFKERNNSIALFLSTIIAILINGPISVVALIPIMGNAVLAYLPVLTGAAALNVVLAHSVYKILPGEIKVYANR
ncbi:MAG: putative rane protein [Clostridiaceae bacterium]|jgi:uncharacterized membrane protein|nr:putative rane protein [Clostridiaceae bacterium]